VAPSSAVWVSSACYAMSTVRFATRSTRSVNTSSRDALPSDLTLRDNTDPSPVSGYCPVLKHHAQGGLVVTFDETLAQVFDLLQRQGRVSYRALKRRFDLDDEYIEDLKAEIIQAQRLAVDEDGAVLVWTGESATTTTPVSDTERSPLSYTPRHLAEKILTSRAALEGERKQVTVLFADIKGSMALLEDLDPEEARRIIDPALQRMMDAVHRYEGCVAQTMGDGILARCLVRLLPMKTTPNGPCMRHYTCRRPASGLPSSSARNSA
jgi:hypothetical protein